MRKPNSILCNPFQTPTSLQTRTASRHSRRAPVCCWHG